MIINPPWLDTLLRELEDHPGARLKDLKGGSRYFVVSLLARNRPVAFIVNNPENLLDVADELSAWLGRERVFAAPPRADSLLSWPHSEDADSPARYRALAALEEPEKLSNPVFVLPPATVAQKMGASSPLHIDVALEQALERDEFISRLLEYGYQPSGGGAYQPGEFAVRGHIVDVYPPEFAPARIEFDGDIIGRIRNYDPATQRSTATINKASFKPMAEAHLDAQSREKAASRIKEHFRDRDSDKVADRILHETLSHSDLSRYLPFFWDKAVSIFDRLPPETLLVFEDGGVLMETLKNMSSRLENEFYNRAPGELLPSLETSYLSLDNLNEILSASVSVEFGGPGIPGRENWPVISVGAEDNSEIRDEIKRSLALEGHEDHQAAHHHGALEPILKRVKTWRGLKWRVTLASADGLSAARFESLLRGYGLDIKVSNAPDGLLADAPPAGEFALMLARISAGFRMPSAGWVVVTEEEIFGPKIKRYRQAAVAPADRLEDLKPGDFIAHVDHGVGMFNGIFKITAGGFENDCARIQYADGAILYLPVHRMNLIEPYSADADELPALDKLGGTAWATSVSRAKKAIEKIAKDLVELYAARKAFDGHAYQLPDAIYREFEATFPYEETPDQARAVGDVIADMTSQKPMDRLICGDVGYGKTEVAIRAAFIAAMSGKQVAVLVPTTLLAHQHYRTFKKRMEPYPLRIEMISRLRSNLQNKEAIKGLEEGKVDVIIGTHRLIQKDVRFRDLGLLIIDEEHRFGVKHKEKIKGFKQLVDALSLSATPIPRTLQMAMLEIWDMSVIETPPPDRLAVRTSVASFNEDMIRDAIRRETARGGQVFFVTPKIQGIEHLARLINRIAPEVRVGIAHGQSDEKELESVMMDFVEGRLDVLVCTSIIESGIDIPRANTILINNAHTFGLASLYQLRGRVGRSSEKAYAHLLIPSKILVSKNARERLRALEEFSELGSGYRLARLDLKIRGAGNILGEAQSGHIHRIGYEMYLELLQKAVRELKGEAVRDEIEPEIQIPVPAFLPDDYVLDPQERVLLYRRLSRTRTENELFDLKGELLDRFGPIPEPAESLLHIIALKNYLREGRVKAMRKEGRSFRLMFASDAPVSPEKLIGMVNESPRKFRLAPDNEIMFMPDSSDMADVVKETHVILKRIVDSDTISNPNRNDAIQ